MNGVLTACAGQLISLTCSHDVQVGITSVTVWRASPPVNCTSLAIHGSGDGCACGPFRFGSITKVNTSGPNPPVLDSTAVATAAVDMTNTAIECSSGTLRVSVGKISLCIVSEF